MIRQALTDKRDGCVVRQDIPHPVAGHEEKLILVREGHPDNVRNGTDQFAHFFHFNFIRTIHDLFVFHPFEFNVPKATGNGQHPVDAVIDEDVRAR